MTVIGEVEGKDIVLVDDLIDTGGTLTKAADMMLDRGAKSVRAVCTHAVLSGKAYERVPPVSIKSSTKTISFPSTSPITVMLSITLAFARCL